MKTLLWNVGLAIAQFDLFDDAGSMLVDGNLYNPFGFLTPQAGFEILKNLKKKFKNYF